MPGPIVSTNDGDLHHVGIALGLPKQTDSGLRSRRASIVKERQANPILHEGEKAKLKSGRMGRTFFWREPSA